MKFQNKSKSSLISKEISEFSSFLGKYSVIALAIGTVIGQSSNEVVQVLVNGIIKPFINILMPDEHIFQITIKAGRETFLIGELINVTIQLLVTMLVTFIAARYLLRDLTKVDGKSRIKAPTKTKKDS